MKTILVAVDGSKPAERALDMASELAQQFGAKVALLHVLLRDKEPEELRELTDVKHVTEPDESTLAEAEKTLRGPVAVGAGFVPRSLSEEALREIGERVLEAARRFLDEKGVTEVTTTLEDGDPAKRVLEAVERENADLVVLGSRGVGPLNELLLGSVSHRVANLAKCPCLVVK